jgi:hypothetical protein
VSTVLVITIAFLLEIGRRAFADPVPSVEGNETKCEASPKALLSACIDLDDGIRIQAP